MRIAVPFQDGMIFQHFGHTAAFKFYDVESGAITGEEVVGTGGQGHGALAAFLFLHHTDAVICGGIGPGAQQALAGAGIRLYAGISGNADEAVRMHLQGTLPRNPGAQCAHHDHGQDHGCGSHGCGAGPCSSCR